MKYKKNRANYNSNPNYLDYLTALQKFFSNNVDIIPIIMDFNFYVNGVFGIPYVDLFRSYEENMEDIHGTVNTKSFIDDGTIGIINEQIYKANGSLMQSLENLRVYLLDRSTKYNIIYNTFINAYSETIKPVVNNLPDANPVVTNNSYNEKLAEIQKLYDDGDIGEGEYKKRISELNAKFLSNDEIKHPRDSRVIGGTKAKITKKNPFKILFSKLGILLNKKKK